MPTSFPQEEFAMQKAGKEKPDIIPEQTRSSPPDVPSIKATVSAEELVEIIRKERGRPREWR
jgi:hypothetical protein